MSVLINSMVVLYADRAIELYDDGVMPLLAGVRR